MQIMWDFWHINVDGTGFKMYGVEFGDVFIGVAVVMDEIKEQGNEV